MFADVTSANIVGYSNKAANDKYRAGVNKIFTVPFNAIGTDGYYVTDIKVTGYEEDTKWQSNLTGPEVELQQLSTGGATEATYVWKDSWNDVEWTGGYWEHYETGKKLVKTVKDPETEEADVLMVPGGCYWAVVPATKTSGTIISLVHNGEVIQLAQTYLLNDKYRAGVNKMVGNLLQRPITITELSVAGYEEDSKWQLNLTGPEVELQQLSTGGATEATYVWIDSWNDTAWAGGYWKHYETGKKLVKTVVNPDTEEEDVTINPADGLWAVCPATKTNGTKVWLVYPKLGL